VRKSELDRRSNIRLFRQIANILKERIEEGVHRGEEYIPAVEQIAREFGVLPSVAKKALACLEEEGWLKRGAEGTLHINLPQAAAGVFLIWDPATLRLDLPGCQEIRVQSKVMTTLPREMLQTFEVHGRSGHQASRIVKLHLVDGAPKAIEQIIAPVSELPGLLMKDHRHCNLYRLVEGDYRLPLVRVTQRIQVRPLTLEEAKILDSAEAFPALCVERLLHIERGVIARVDWIVPGGRCELVEEGCAGEGPGGRRNA
jgi:DNA-binding GntR family transcriptional regulator